MGQAILCLHRSYGHVNHVLVWYLHNIMKLQKLMLEFDLSYINFKTES
jgi:hypothetical protein